MNIAEPTVEMRLMAAINLFVREPFICVPSVWLFVPLRDDDADGSTLSIEGGVTEHRIRLSPNYAG